jgi:hypothetical protein
MSTGPYVAFATITCWLGHCFGSSSDVWVTN